MNLEFYACLSHMLKCVCLYTCKHTQTHTYTYIHILIHGKVFIVNKLTYATNRTKWFMLLFQFCPLHSWWKILTALLILHLIFFYNGRTYFILSLSQNSISSVFLLTWKFHFNFEITFMAGLTFCATVSLTVMKCRACKLLFFAKVTKMFVFGEFNFNYAGR